MAGCEGRIVRRMKCYERGKGEAQSTKNIFFLSTE